MNHTRLLLPIRKIILDSKIDLFINIVNDLMNENKVNERESN